MSNSFSISDAVDIAAAVVKIEANKTVIDENKVILVDLHDTDLPAAVTKIDANKSVLDTINAKKLLSSFYIGSGQFAGDGSDGDVTISSNTAIDSFIKNYNNLTIDATFTLSPSSSAPYGSLFICVKETITINGIISASYKGGAGGLSREDGDGYIGQQGMYAGAASEVACASLGGAGGGGGRQYGTDAGGNGGGAGGTGGIGGVSGGNGSVITPVKASLIEFRSKEDILNSLGGGGGGGSSTANGGPGNGGAGGALIYIECDTFILNSGASIVSLGQASVAEEFDKGGGGGGGVVLIRARVIQTNDGTITVTGGIGGGGGNGADGQVIIYEIKVT